MSVRNLNLNAVLTQWPRPLDTRQAHEVHSAIYWALVDMARSGAHHGTVGLWHGTRDETRVYIARPDHDGPATLTVVDTVRHKVHSIMINTHDKEAENE